MSLINVAQQVRGPRTLTHTVLAVLALLVATILLGRIGLGWRHSTLIEMLTAATTRWPALRARTPGTGSSRASSPTLGEHS